MKPDIARQIWRNSIEFDKKKSQNDVIDMWLHNLSRKLKHHNQSYRTLKDNTSQIYKLSTAFTGKKETNKVLIRQGVSFSPPSRIGYRVRGRNIGGFCGFI